MLRNIPQPMSAFRLLILESVAVAAASEKATAMLIWAPKTLPHSLQHATPCNAGKAMLNWPKYGASEEHVTPGSEKLKGRPISATRSQLLSTDHTASGTASELLVTITTWLPRRLSRHHPHGDALEKAMAKPACPRCLLLSLEPATPGEALERAMAKPILPANCQPPILKPWSKISWNKAKVLVMARGSPMVRTSGIPAPEKNLKTAPRPVERPTIEKSMRPSSIGWRKLGRHHAASPLTT